MPGYRFINSYQYALFAGADAAGAFAPAAFRVSCRLRSREALRSERAFAGLDGDVDLAAPGFGRLVPPAIVAELAGDLDEGVLGERLGGSRGVGRQ
jgi:hypothetical protein